MKVKFCPKCGNTDLAMVAGGNIGIWKCKKCKFQGSVFPEKEIGKIIKLKRKLRRKNARRKNK